MKILNIIIIATLSLIIVVMFNPKAFNLETSADNSNDAIVKSIALKGLPGLNVESITAQIEMLPASPLKVNLLTALAADASGNSTELSAILLEYCKMKIAELSKDGTL
jgi:hypothetical protein